MQGATPVPPAPVDLENGRPAEDEPPVRRRSRRKLLAGATVLALGLASVCAWLASEGAFTEGSGFWSSLPRPARTPVSRSPYDSPDATDTASPVGSGAGGSADENDKDGNSSGPSDEPVLPNGFARRSTAVSDFLGVFSDDAHNVIFEVPASALGTPFVVDALASKADGQSTLYHSPIADVDERVFELRMGSTQAVVDLVKPELGLRARPNTTYARVLERSAWSGWEGSFDVVARHTRAGVDYVYIDVTAWALGGCGALSYAGRAANARMTGVGAYAHNVRLEAEYRFETTDADGHTEVAHLGVHYALAKLPSTPAQPRALDARVGYFASRYVELGAPAEGPLVGADRVVRMIHRWRLEPSNVTVAAADDGRPLVVPARPITFHIDPSVPRRWREPLAEGVLRWNRAFEQAGWADALAVLTPDDPGWPAEYDAGDMRFSTISWAVSTASTFAVAPSTHDPRTGEILNSDIMFTHSWVRAWLGDWEALDDRRAASSAEEAEADRRVERALAAMRARTHEHQGPCGLSHAHEHGSGGALAVRHALRATAAAGGQLAPTAEDGEIGLPEAYARQALADVAMHEVGHALGLRHNFKGSAGVAWTQLSNRTYTAEHGLSASVMDYLPPAVHADPARQGDFFGTRVGAYDRWAIEYGYARVSSDAELEQIAGRVTEDDRLQFGTDEDEPGPDGTDPTVARWDLGSEPLEYAHNALELAVSLLQGALTDAAAPPLSPASPPPPPALSPPRAVQPLADASANASTTDGNATSAEIPQMSVAARQPRGARPFALAARVHEALRPITSAAVIAAKHVGGIERRKQGEPGPVMLPSSAERTRRALGVLERVLTDDGLVPPASLWEHLAAPAGWCAGVGDYCLGTREVDTLARVRELRAHALELVLQPARLRSTQLSAWALASAGNESVGVAEVLRSLSAALWSQPPDASIAGLGRQLQRTHLAQLLALAKDHALDEAGVIAAHEAAHVRALAREQRRTLQLGESTGQSGEVHYWNTSAYDAAGVSALLAHLHAIEGMTS